MTVGELKYLLEDYDEEAEVRIATQPSWPLQSSVAGLISSEELPEDEDNDPNANPEDGVVWIVEGQQCREPSPYAPRGVFENR